MNLTKSVNKWVQNQSGFNQYLIELLATFVILLLLIPVLIIIEKIQYIITELRRNG